jgi:hypothetical protein
LPHWDNSSENAWPPRPLPMAAYFAPPVPQHRGGDWRGKTSPLALRRSSKSNKKSLAMVCAQTAHFCGIIVITDINALPRREYVTA